MKDFVPHNESLELKELGFDEPCIRGWDGFGKIWYHPDSDVVLDNPTFSQAFRFFRERYDLDIISRPHIGKSKKYICDPVGLRLQARDTPEEAELACLQQLIKIVKDEKHTYTTNHTK